MPTVTTWLYPYFRNGSSSNINSNSSSSKQIHEKEQDNRVCSKGENILRLPSLQKKCSVVEIFLNNCPSLPLCCYIKTLIQNKLEGERASLASCDVTKGKRAGTGEGIWRWALKWRQCRNTVVDWLVLHACFLIQLRSPSPNSKQK